MEESGNQYRTYNLNKKVIRLFVSLLLLILPFYSLYSQAPTWLAGTPSVVSVGPTSITVNFGINMTGNVYIMVMNYDAGPYTSATVKASAPLPPAGSRVAGGVFPVTAGTANTVIQTTFYVTQANRLYSIFLVAENSSGVLQAVPIKLLATTLPCPKIDILTGFTQPVVCVNKGNTAVFQTVILAPLTSGILKNTTWFIDWGDGTTLTYTSTADNDYPPLALRTHTYTAVTNCNYVFTNTVRNPCGETRSVQYVAVVHGRDTPSDGDGQLRIVNQATGSAVINICEGIQSVITLQDNSTWNCQNPVLPGTLTAVPNLDARNIEWLYGRDPGGAATNTITGGVTIAGMGGSPQASGRISPTPYGPSSLSQAITIPASCKAGEYFRVYLKNWNKCNWTDPEYVSTYVDINVVAAPPAPTALSRTVCFGANRTLSVSSPPVGTITWYSNAALTNVLGTGVSYTPAQTAAGSYNFWVADRSTTGLQCQSPGTLVTLTINPIPQKPTINHPLKNDICYDGGITTYTMTAVPVTPPAVSSYQWFKDGVAVAGETNASIVISQPNQTGSYTVASVGIAPSNCMGPQSDPWYVTVHTLSNLTNPVPVTICQNQSAVFTASTTDQVQNWQWEVSTDGGTSFTTVGNGPPYSGFTSNTLTITTPPPSFDGYYYRVEIKTPPGQGGCPFKSGAAMLTVNALPTASAGPAIKICSSSPTDPIPMTGALAGGTYTSAVWTGGGALGAWTQNSDPALATFTPTGNSGSFTATLRVTGTAACSGVVATSTRTVAWSKTPTAEAGNDISRCDANPTAFIAMTGASAGGSYSTANWSGGVGLGSWTQNANPALSRFTPTASSGSFTATLTVSGKDGCSGYNPTDTRTITWGRTPVADAGPDIYRCDGSPQANITMTGATAVGTYINATWSGGAGLGTWTQNTDPALATFKPNANFGNFTATLTITGAGACLGSNSTDTRVVDWSYSATVSAGPDQSICATATATLAGTIGGGATTATWTGGTGTFNPNNTTLNAIYTPSGAERIAQTVTLTLTTNDPAGNCPAVSDNMTIAIGTMPTSATLTSSGNACFGSGASWISSTITGGAPPYTISYRVNGGPVLNINNYISGSNSSLGNLPVGTYTYQVTQIKDGCNNLLPVGGLPGPVTIIIYQVPVANAGGDQALCATLNATLSAIPSVGTGTWTLINGPGTVTFNPDANTSNAAISVSSYGSYVLRWTEVNGICSSSSDKTVLFERAATVGPDQNFCGTLTGTLAGNAPAVGTGTWTKVSGPGTATFTPNANTPNATVTVSLPGPYVLKWTIANGVFCSTNASVTFTFEKAANAGPAQHLCNTLAATLAGNTPALGTGTWSFVSGPGSVAFTPNVNTPAATATVTALGTYIFKWTIANGAFCSTEQNVSITYNPAGQVDQPSSQVVCNGSNTTAVSFTTTNPGGTTTYSWTNNTPSIGLPATGNGDIASFAAVNIGSSPVTATITVTPTYSDGTVNCVGTSKSFTITVNPSAQVNQPGSQVLCNGGTTSAVTFGTINTGGTTTYAWTNSEPTIGLAANGTGGSIPAFTATNGGSSPVVATITVTPTYTNATVSCTGPSKNFTITVNPTGQVNQPGNQVLCNGSATDAVNFGTANSGGTTTYSWTNNTISIGLAASGSGNTIPSFNAINNGTSPVTATIIVTPTFTNATVSCTGPTKTFTITVNPTAQVNQPGNQTLCNNTATTTVTFGTLNSGGTMTYSWTNNTPSIGLAASGSGPTIPSFTALNAGTAPVTATIIVTPSFLNATVSCTGPTKTFTITVNPTPVLTSTLTPTAVCSNTLFSYTPTSATTGTTFNWTRAAVAGITPAGPTSGTNNANETLRNLTSAPVAVTYAYTLQANGCSNTQNVVVSVKPEPAISNQSTTVCSNIQMNYRILLDNFTNPDDGVTFTWPVPSLSPGIAGGTARGSASSDNITDTYTNISGSLGTATYHITPYYNGCQGAPKDIIVTVGSQPVLDPGLNLTVCSSVATGLILHEAPGSVVPTHYNIISITRDPGLNSTPGNVVPNATAPANYLSGDIFTNYTGVNKNVTYRIQPVLAPDCFGDPVDVVVTVRPQPVILPGQVKTVCSRIPIGKEIVLVPANTPAGTVFNWGVPLMSDASGQGTAGVNVAADPAGKVHINDVIHNYTAAPITATYTVTPASQQGCAGTPATVVITINQEPVPQPISGRINLCANEKNVVYNVSPVGGSSFHWTVDPAVGTKTFDYNTNAILIDAASSTGSGNISVYETNSLGCSGDPSSKTVNVYTQPPAETINGDAVVCSLSTHVYSITNRAGSIYSWTIPGGAAIIGDPSSNSVTVLFGNTGGTILVRETNIAGCVTNHTPLSVTVNPLPTAVISNGGTICDGATRPLNVVFFGTPPYSFAYAINGVPQTPVSTSSNPYTLNATLQGTYTIVNVTDNTGCTNTGSGTAVVSFFAKPTGTISGTTQICRGSSATLTMTFTGTPPFTFTYTDGTTPVTVNAHPFNIYTASVSPVATTTYTLTSVTDNNSCSGLLSGTAVITVNQPPVLSLTGTNLICYNVNTGAIDLSISGGTPPFGITWTGPDGFTAPVEDISGLKAGYYSVTVSDSKGCGASANITLTQPPALNASLASTNVTCFGANDGTITISGASGGTGNYEYTVNGGTSWFGSGIFTNLAPGTYNVRMRDAVNPTCILTLNNSLVLTGPAILSGTVAKTDITCFGAGNGSITISTPTGGYGTYQYSINGGTNWVGTGSFTNLTAGTYNVRMRDAANTTCSVILDPAVVISEPPLLSASVAGTNITCFGSTDGTITVSSPAGGHGTYQYSINGGGSWQNNGTYTGLTPGSYNVQIRDASLPTCYIVLNSALVLTQPAVLAATVSSSNISCNGADDGTISITAPSGGHGNYEFSINGGTGWFPSGSFTGLAPGTYDVRIRDGANTGCFIILNAGLQITEPDKLDAMVVKTDITCFGANDGVISVTNSAGGYGTYQYSVNGGTTWQNSPIFSPLTPGSYNVRMRDRAHNLCVVILDPAVQITAPAALNATVTSANVSCKSANDGTITISSPTGGYGTYSYSINGGGSWQGSGIFTNLAPGTYNVRIRDALNTSCSVILNPALVITEPAVLSATVSATNVTCNGASDGTISITNPAGGYGAYEYTVNGGGTWQTSGSFTALAPGFYNVRIRDAAQPLCVKVLNPSLRITEPSLLSAAVASTNITCNGANDGTITISSPSGGYGTYQFSVDGGTSWQASGSFTGLAPSNYNVLIHDAAHPACFVTLNGSLSITEPDVLNATVTPLMVTCFGAGDGVISITNPTGGYGSYEYSVNGGSIWTGSSSFTSLAPGTYNVRIRDAAHHSCTVILNPAVQITQPAVLHADVAGTNISCYGGSDGTITLSNPTGGNGVYEYTVNGGGYWQLSGIFTGLGPGTYNVQIRDAAHPGCTIVLNNAFVISQPSVLKANIASTPATCNGATDGTITVSGATGGSGLYDYSINGGFIWQPSGLFTGLAPSTYDVRIRDAAHLTCEIILNPGLTISEPAVLNAVVASTNVTCNGANDGTITVSSPSGGYGTYEYSVDGGSGWQVSGSFSSLAPGPYDVRIRDRAHAGCVIVLNAGLVITQPAVLSASVASTNITCNGAGDGTITISSPAGGYGTYQYSITGGASWQAFGTFTGVAPGTHNVRIRDAAHVACEIILNPALVLTQPAKLTATVTPTNVSCFGANDGMITITSPAGGYGTFEYSIDGGTSWQSSGAFAALAPGNYNVQIRDGGNISCVVMLNGSLRITEPAILNANVASTNVTCFGSGDGRISITSPSGGYGTYGYSIDGGTTWQASGVFNSLLPGSYNVQIHDAAHITCVIILNPALDITQPSALTASATSTDVTCNGLNDGTITISGAAGGYGTYQYSINGGTIWFGSGNFQSLAPGTYNVRIRDAANQACVAIINPALVIAQPAALNAAIASTNISCFGNGDGTITISSPTGGYGLYEYTINGGGSWQSSGSFTGLGPGNYNVQMRDASHTGCIKVLNSNLALTQPAALNAVVTPVMVTCNAANDGIITITSPTGGSGSYEYSVDGGISWFPSGSFTGLAPATYNVRIHDAVNTSCVITLNNNLLITEPSALNAVLSSTNITCNGAGDGTINITFATGGYGTYEYTIDGGLSWQVSGNYSGLAPGNYSVWIRDKAHQACIRILNPLLALSQPAVLSASVTQANVTCNGVNDGMITISGPLGGYGTYSYSVNGGSSWQSSGTFNSLAPGIYDVRMRDAANPACIVILSPSLTITQPAVLNASVTSTNVSCYGSSDGTITISSPTGGYGTYQYTVNGGGSWQASGSFTGLAPGFYNVQVRDAAYTGCVRTLNGSLRITEPSLLAAIVSKTDATCSGTNDGSITITGATGGYGAFEFSIDGGSVWQSSGSFTSLGPGTYDVRIRDAAHATCSIVLNPSVTIAQPAVLAATVTPSMISCFGANDGVISITNQSGGSGFYMYSVTGGSTWQGTATFYNLAPGNYDVRIRDAVNITCTRTLNPLVAITQPAALSATISGTGVTCFGGNDGTISITGATGGYGTYQFSINGGGSWQASGSFTGLTPGTYTILMRDAARTNCIAVLNNAYIISQPGLLSASISKTEVTCHGNNDGSITVSNPLGGSGTYEYSADGGSGWQPSGTFSNLSPGTYDIRMRDQAHPACSVILYPNLVITEPLILSLSSTGDVVLDCNGDIDGSGTFYSSGGTMPYSFVVGPNTTGATIPVSGFNSQSFFNAGAGSITVMVVDLNGCSAQAVINITQPAALTPGSISADQVLCSGDNPAALTASTAPTGGPGAYVYQWQSSPNPAGPFINIAGGNSGTFTPPAGATYTLYYRRMVSSGVCLPVYSNVIEVRVNPVPIALLTGGETICPGQSSLLRVNLPSGTAPFTLDIDNLGTINNYASGSDIPVTPASTTTYRVTRVRDANGCQVTSPSPNISGSATVVVNSLPGIISFTPPPAVCEYALATFNVTATGSNLTYQWYVNEGSGFNPVSDGATYFGSFTPTLQIFNSVRTMNGYIYHAVITGCGNSVTTPDAVLTVNTPPEVTTQPRDTTICVGQNAVMQAAATGTSISWQWYVNKGAGFVPVTDNANFSGSATNTLSITNAGFAFNNWVFRAMVTGICGVPVGTSFSVLRVINPPIVTLQPLARSVCENSTTSFFSNGTAYMSLQWQEFTGGSWNNLNDDAVYVGTHSQMLSIMNASPAMNGNQYRLALTGTCATVYSNPANLTVNLNPVAGISALSPVNACGGVPLVLNGNPSGGSGSYLQHRWTGDVGPLNSYTVQSPIFNSFIPASYILNYKVTDSNGCSGSGDVTVIVDSPDAMYTQDVDFGCTPLQVSFTKDMTGLAKWWWDFGDGSPADSVNANPVHTFTNTLSGSIEYYNVSLMVRSAGGCTARYATTITVYPEVDASFTPDRLVVCSGSAVTFTAATGAGRYFWNYGDGVNGYGAYIASHLYTNFTTSPVVRTVTLTTTSFYNCTDVKTVDITVMPVPQPQFTADPVTQVYSLSGNPVTFTNTTNAGTWNWQWRFGDNSSSTDMNPVHSYSDVGSYPVTLVASNGSCRDSVMHEVYVTPLPPVASFDSVASGCSPLYVDLNNTSLNTEIPGTTYHWSFGDGSVSTAKNPTYTYTTPGTYRIELAVMGPGGTSTFSRVVNAWPSPKAYFEVSPSKVFTNDENVRCFNLSQGATAYVWDFGDGDTSRVAEPYHKYMEEGVYDITLWAYSANGCTDKYILSPAVTVEPVGELRFPSVFTPNKTGPIERSDLPTSGIEADQFFYPPIRQQVINYKLQIFNRWGVLIFKSDKINVPWNGYYQGELCQQGVYVWYVEGKYADGRPFKMVGNVTLLH